MSVSFESCKEESKVKIVELKKSWETETGILGFGRVDWKGPGIAISDDGPGDVYQPEVPEELERGGVPIVPLASTSSLPDLEEPDFFDGK